MFSFYYSLYRKIQNSINYNSDIISSLIKLEIEDILLQNTRILKYLGNIIISNKRYKEPDKLALELANISNLNLTNFTKSYISWAEPSGKVKVSGKEGVLNTNFPDITKRSYYIEAKNQPWNLYIANQDISLFSATKVIPTAMGISDSNNKFLGFLLLGLRVNEISEKLEKICEALKLNYIVFDNKFNIIFHSRDNSITELNKNDKENLFQIYKTGLPNNLKIDNVNYRSYSKAYNNQYIILAGINNAQYINEIAKIFSFKISEIIIMGCLFLVIILQYKNKFNSYVNLLHQYTLQISNGKTNIKLPKPRISILNLICVSLLIARKTLSKHNKETIQLKEELEIIKNSDKASTDYQEELNNMITNHTKSISMSSSVLVKNFKKNIDIKMSESQIINFLEDISYNSFILRSKVYKTLNLTYFNINELIENAISITLKKAYSNQIKLIKYLEALPIVYADNFLLKQLLVTLLNTSIKNSPLNSEISISSQLFEEEKIGYIQIVIKDNGFGFKKEEIDQFFFNNNVENRSEEISFDSIQEIIKLHNGILTYNSKKYVGNEAIIVLPITYSSRSTKNTTSKVKGNIYKLNSV